MGPIKDFFRDAESLDEETVKDSLWLMIVSELHGLLNIKEAQRRSITTSFIDNLLSGNGARRACS